MKHFNALNNIQVGSDYVVFSINPKIYSIKKVKTTALKMTKDACVILDWNDDELLIELRPKKFSKTKIIEQFCTLLLKC